VNKRIQRNAATTLVNITYYGGTISAGLAFDHVLNSRTPLAMTTLVVFVLTVEGVLRTLLGEFMHAVTPQQDTDGPEVPAAHNDIPSRVGINLRDTTTVPQDQPSRVRGIPAK
jgi:hypothetical protein